MIFQIAANITRLPVIIIVKMGQMHRASPFKLQKNILDRAVDALRVLCYPQIQLLLRALISDATRLVVWAILLKLVLMEAQLAVILINKSLRIPLERIC